MKKLLRLLLAFGIFSFACQSSLKQDNTTKERLKAEIATLKTNEEKTAYLENIYYQDQKVRTNETDILTQYGHDSKEHKAQWDLINKTDELNLLKIEAYLDAYGHPQKNSLSETAVGTPYIVIHHQSRVEPRRRNFHYLYNAYKNGDLGGGSFAFYLNRFYKHEFGHRLELKSPFTEEFEIDTLVKALRSFTE